MLITGERNRRGKRIEIYVLHRDGAKQAQRVVEKLLERGWDADTITHPTLTIATTAPPRMFEKAWDASKAGAP